jgi:hypothetical protein
MTVKAYGPSEGSSHLLGLSTDDKPDNGATGSTFYETDTGLWFLFDGLEWVRLYLPGAAVE